MRVAIPAAATQFLGFGVIFLIAKIGNLAEGSATPTKCVMARASSSLTGSLLWVASLITRTAGAALQLTSAPAGLGFWV